jgi:nanoRNase/pAp phosphatase (c-di-AMP/oligoRNAs hydrolase)
MTNILCHHYPCVDGSYAALAVALAKANETVVFVPHNTAIPLHLEEVRQQHPDLEATLFLLDYCGPGPAFLEQACELFKSVILIDHHKTAFEMLQTLGTAKPANLTTYMSNKCSGCVLAHQYTELVVSPQLQRVYDYVSDNDLWEHALESSRLFTAGFQSLQLELDFNKNPTLFKTLQEINVDELIVLGEIELERQARLIAARIESSFWQVFRGNVRVLCAHISPADYGITSQLGHELAVLNKDTGMGGVLKVHETDPKLIRVSLRGRDPSVDTTAVSKLYGGGGHAGASGFTVSVEELNGNN